jgi:hypothetical protein
MRPDDPRVLAVAAAIVGLVDALAPERGTGPGGDELLAYPFGLERRAAGALVRQGALTTRKIGRKLYARRSDVVALVAASPAPATAPTAAPANDAASAARSRYADPLRVIGKASR